MTKYVIKTTTWQGNTYSKAFDTQHDAELAVELLQARPAFTHTKYEVLNQETLHGQRYILDPECPEDYLYHLPA